MVNEYELNYTASDINAKLGVIDGTKKYYNSDEVDEKIENLNTQSDFSQTDETKKDFIKNKPTKLS